MDKDPFPQTIGTNMVRPDLTKVSLPKFKLVLDERMDKKCPSALDIIEAKGRVTYNNIILIQKLEYEIRTKVCIR